MKTKAAKSQAGKAVQRKGQRHTHRKVKTVQAPRIDAAALGALEQINLHAAGIDVGSTERITSAYRRTRSSRVSQRCESSVSSMRNWTRRCSV